MDYPRSLSKALEASARQYGQRPTNLERTFELELEKLEEAITSKDFQGDFRNYRITEITLLKEYAKYHELTTTSNNR
jgi:hypothetical protein